MGSTGSTFFSLHYHIVFSTKERRPFIKPEWQPRVHAYLGGIIKGMNGVPEIVGGVEDHVHILASLRPVHCIADVLRDLKKESSTGLKRILIADSPGKRVMRRSP
jgi:putative transposase